MKIRKNIRSQHLMKKIILILITVFLTTNVYAHPTKGVTPNLDYSAQCTGSSAATGLFGAEPSVVITFE